MLADIYASDYQLGYALRPDGLEDSLILANRAVSLNPGCQFAYWALSLNYFLRRDQDRFQYTVAQIIPLNPANTYTMAGAGLLVGMAEDLDKGNAIMQRAAQLNPKLPSWFHIIPFMMRYKAGHYEAALTEAMQINTPDCFWDPMLRAAAYGRLGLLNEAQAALKQLLALQPAFVQQEDMLLQALLHSSEHVDLIRQGLADAGLKV
jgi:Flp pilus assembly protein TadD